MADPTEKNPLGAGIKPGQSMVRSSPVMRIQALAMMREMTLGKSVAEVAAKFNVSQHIVKARLNYAQRAGLFTQHEDILLSQMVPLAEQAMLTFLQPNLVTDKDGEVVDVYYTKDQAVLAAKVYDGTGLFRKPGTRAPAATENDGKGTAETLESHIAKLRQAQQLQVSTGAIDAEFSTTLGVLGQLTGDAGSSAAGTEPPGQEQGRLSAPLEADGQAPQAASETTSSPDGTTGQGDSEFQLSLFGEIKP